MSSTDSLAVFLLPARPTRPVLARTDSPRWAITPPQPPLPLFHPPPPGRVVAAKTPGTTRRALAGACRRDPRILLLLAGCILVLLAALFALAMTVVRAQVKAGGSVVAGRYWASVAVIWGIGVSLVASTGLCLAAFTRRR